MIEVKDNICHGMKSTEVTFKVNIKRDIFEGSYDDTILRNAIESQLIRLLQKDLDNMCNEYNRIKFDKEDK